MIRAGNSSVALLEVGDLCDGGEIEVLEGDGIICLVGSEGSAVVLAEPGKGRAAVVGTLDRLDMSDGYDRAVSTECRCMSCLARLTSCSSTSWALSASTLPSKSLRGSRCAAMSPTGSLEYRTATFGSQARARTSAMDIGSGYG